MCTSTFISDKQFLCLSLTGKVEQKRCLIASVGTDFLDIF